MTDRGILDVPGASIYYEKRGSGPTLLMIPGGATDAGIFSSLARQLADRYTVVAYDPRGNSRSTLAGHPETQRLDVHADDAARLIELFGGEAAYVFGTSGGAQIGLDLAARYPERVRVLVAHEPPCLLLLADPTSAVADDQSVYDTYQREGVEAAMQQFMAMNGLAGGPEEGDSDGPALSPEDGETFARIAGNAEYFFAHGLMPLSLYRPDVDALRAGRPRIVVAVGELSVGQTTHHTSIALADQLGTSAAHFPGDHMGFGAHADAFAIALDAALNGAGGVAGGVGGVVASHPDVAARA